MATIQAFLNKQYENKDGYQIVIKITHRGGRKLEGIGYSIPEENWNEDAEDSKMNWVVDTKKSKVSDRITINETISDMLTKARNYEKECRNSGTPFQLNKVFNKPNDKGNLSEYLRGVAQRLGQEERYGYQRTIRALIKNLRDWQVSKKKDNEKTTKETSENEAKKHDTSFHELNSLEVKNLHAFMISDGLKASTRKVKIAILSGMWNAAIKDIGAPKENPFHKFQIKVAPAKKAWLTKEQLKTLALFKGENGKFKNLEMVRDMFLFSYYCYGMRYENVINLKKTDIHSGRAHWKAVKSGKHIHVNIHTELQAIIDRYFHSPGEFLFPILNKKKSKKEGVKLYNYKINRNHITNSSLRVLSKRLELPLITFHAARHSFATHAINDGVPIQNLSKMLTHSSIAMTEKYIREIDSASTDAFADNFYSQNKVTNTPVIDISEAA